MLFSKIDVNKVEWLNLVFENRNQSYGAYVLRKESGNYLFKSLLITGFLFGGGILLSNINSKANFTHPVTNTLPADNPDEIHIIPVETVLPKSTAGKPEVSPPPARLKPDLQQVNFSGNIRPVNSEATAKEMPTAKQIEQSLIGLEDNAGLSAEGINGGSSSGTGNGTETNGGDGTAGGTDVYTRGFLEVLPEFPGGMKAWSKFLTRNLQYPHSATENRITGKVIVSFVIERNGEISNLKVVKGIGGGCDEEAMRVIKKSPFWKPGMQNGRAVRVAYMMPVVFRME